MTGLCFGTDSTACQLRRAFWVACKCLPKPAVHAPYRSGLQESRLKLKCVKSDTLPIVAFVEKLGARPPRIASLISSDGKAIGYLRREGGLRKERDRVRLTTEIIAGKEYTTLKAIEKKRELCRVQAKVFASSGERKASAKTAPLGALPVGGSGTKAISTARELSWRN
jgi:hypothetical protein